MKSTYAFLLAGLAAQQATATWNFFDKFNTPDYNTNECSDKQKSGFDWSDIKDGDKDFQYGDFDFSKGWSCSSSLGKRDHISKRTFGNKVVKNSCSKDKPASFGCGDKKKSGFSITDMDISVEFDVDLELHYTMVDGSKVSNCSLYGASMIADMMIVQTVLKLFRWWNHIEEHTVWWRNIRRYLHGQSLQGR